MPRGINSYDEARLQGRNVANAGSFNIVSPGIVTSGLVAHFDAGNYTSYPIAGTTWYDLSGLGTIATLTNGPVYSRDTGGYIIVDGIDDRITTTAVPAFGTEYSFSFWVYIISLPSSGEQQLFVCNTVGISVATYLDGLWRWSSYESVFNNVRYGSVVSTGVWYNFVLTNTGSTTRFYVNGQFTNQFSNGPSVSSAGLVYFWNGGTRYMNARSAINMAHNRSLNQPEVEQNFNATRARFGI